MKRIALISVVLCAFFSSVAFSAERIEVNDKGEIRTTHVDVDTWRPLTKEENQAIKNPGREIPIDLHRERIERADFFHYNPTNKYTRIVIYENGILITKSKAGEMREEERINVYVVFLLIAIIFMAISNIVTKITIRKNSEFTTTAAFAIATTTTFAIAAAIAADFAAFVALSALAAAGAYIVIVNEKKWYIAFSVLFYVFAVIALFI